MGVYIKGMEMPKDHLRVLVLHPDGRVIDEWGNTYQASLLPPHGRLIDKDALEADISASVVFSGRDGNAEIVGAKKIINRLHLAPTIIPASFENLPKNARYSQDNPAEEGE